MAPNLTELKIPLAALANGDRDVTQLVLELLIQLAVILFAAKLAGELALRFLKVPPVLAELAVGVVIGPYALGGVEILGVGPLFPMAGLGGASARIPLSNELFGLAQIGSIVLLFTVGLKTDLRQFLRYAGPGTAVAAGGVVLPFGLGVAATAWLGFGGADSLWSPQALFIGAIMTATSVGITARVLEDLNRLGSPEGMTIIAAAVIDDVIGILVLVVVVGLSTAESFSLGQAGWVSFKAIAFWLGLTGVGILAAPYIYKGLSHLRSPGAMAVLSLALALLAAGLAELFGLAFIIGAFSIGLALSTTELAGRIEGALEAIGLVVVPIFFVAMGMLVDLGSMGNAVGFGLLISALAIIGKLIGGGGPALASGFNLKGSFRVGLGMVPRGEVALIIAGIGLAKGAIGQDLFGVGIMMTVITTVIAPLALVPAFRAGGSGLRRLTPPQAEPDDP